MRLVRGPSGAMLALVAAVIIQTTLFGRVRLAGLAPDIVMVVVPLTVLRLRNEQALVVAFLGGLVFDALSANALGLRAFVYTAVAFIAIRTQDRADFSAAAVAVWIGAISIVGVALLLILGTLFGQFGMDGGEAMRRLLLIPIFDFLVALVASPISTRLLEPARRGGL